MKKLLYGIGILGLVFGISTVGNTTFAQENIEKQNICLTGKTIELVGLDNYLVGEKIDIVPTEIISGSTVDYTLYLGDTVLKKVHDVNFTDTISKSGTYRLHTVITSEDCKYITDTPIKVYQEVINIIGQVGDVEKKLLPYDKIFEDHAILVNTIPLEGEHFATLLDKSINKLKVSSTLIITSHALDRAFQPLIQLAHSSDLNLKNKNIVIVNGMNRHLMKRIVSKYSKDFDPNKMHTTDNQNFINLIAALANQEDIMQSEYLTLFSLSEQKVSSYLFLSKMVDKLIYHGFPIDLIGLLLTISLAVLAVTLFRQVIGFDIFGSYTPLMTGLSIYFLGLSLSLVLFFFAFIATILVRLFTKRFYLLYSAKISLLISLYFLSIFIGLSFFPVVLSDTINFSLFSNAFVIFPMLLIILVSEKLFYEGFKIISKGWWGSVIEFVIVSYVVYLIINSINVQNFMLSYPEAIMLVIVLIILVGRFSGLQLLEYFRFYPLLKANSQDEEEE